MDNRNKEQNGASTVVNGLEGTWMPVDASTLPFSVTGDPNQPMVGPDGAYYCMGQQAGPAPISANQYNAIPAPSNIVQLPPIIQPIALVPYATQNQPLVQYDPNYRPEIPPLANEPIYREKPYAGLSVFLILIAVVSVVAVALINAILAASKGVTGMDAIFGVLVHLGVGSFSSTYYTQLMAGAFADGSAVSSTAKAVLYVLPILYLLVVVIAVLLVIKYLVRLGKRRSPRSFSILTLIGLILAIANVILLYMGKSLTDLELGIEMGAYIIAGAYLILFIFPFFARKGAVVLDYQASKRPYIHP